mgnify:CR=1 FL=1
MFTTFSIAIIKSGKFEPLLYGAILTFSMNYLIEFLLNKTSFVYF